LIKLKEAAEAKIHAFMTLLGADARILTEGEPVGSHELFNRLISKKTITGEDETEESALKYLNAIKEIRDQNPDLFEKLKRLPKKARTARKHKDKNDFLLTYFRKGKIQKFYKSDKNKESEELDFLSAAKMFETESNTKKENIKNDYYKFLEGNKKAFEFATTEEVIETQSRAGRDSAIELARILKSKEIKNYKGFTKDNETYLKQVIKELEEGGLPKQTSKRIIKELEKELKKGINPLRVLAILKMNIPSEFLQETIIQSSAQTSGPREVILSEYFLTE